MYESPFSGSSAYRPVETVEYRGVRLPMRFDERAAEYDRVRASAGLFDRSDRGLLVVAGRDRKDWLHNLVTNAVKTLDAGGGNYAFGCDVRGRVLFDLNVLALPESLWLDVDRLAAPGLLEHLERYQITEDVMLADESDAYARLAVAGPSAAQIAAAIGVANFVALPALGHVKLLAEACVGMDTGSARLVRHDFCGQPGFELIAARGDAHHWWERLAAAGARPAGHDVLDVLRIEAGVPWFGRDIDEQVLPPETGQVERGISYHKGCYLGQEIIERMRSHGSLARRLMRLRVREARDLPLPAAMRQGEKEVGRITSLVRHPREPFLVGLGYLRTAVRDAVGISAGDPPRAVEVIPANAG